MSGTSFNLTDAPPTLDTHEGDWPVELHEIADELFTVVNPDCDDWRTLYDPSGSIRDAVIAMAWGVAGLSDAPNHNPDRIIAAIRSAADYLEAVTA